METAAKPPPLEEAEREDLADLAAAAPAGDWCYTETEDGTFVIRSIRTPDAPTVAVCTSEAVAAYIAAACASVPALLAEIDELEDCVDTEAVQCCTDGDHQPCSGLGCTDCDGNGACPCPTGQKKLAFCRRVHDDLTGADAAAPPRRFRIEDGPTFVEIAGRANEYQIEGGDGANSYTRRYVAENFDSQLIDLPAAPTTTEAVQ